MVTGEFPKHNDAGNQLSSREFPDMLNAPSAKRSRNGKIPEKPINVSFTYTEY
jgi:hypothetical protein